MNNVEEYTMPGRKSGSKNRFSKEKTMVLRLQQQIAWRREGLCIVCGGEHDERWHARQRAEYREREAMLNTMEENS